MIPVDETPGRADDGRANGTPVCKCGALELSASDATRCRAGHPLPGYPGPAFKHGATTLERRGRESIAAEFRERTDAFELRVLEDLGGAASLSAIQLGYVRRLAECEAACQLLAEDLKAHGLHTPRGRVRGTYARWLDSLDRWDRFAQRVGVAPRGTQTDSLSAMLQNAARASQETAGEAIGPAAAGYVGHEADRLTEGRRTRSLEDVPRGT